MWGIVTRGCHRQAQEFWMHLAKFKDTEYSFPELQTRSSSPITHMAPCTLKPFTLLKNWFCSILSPPSSKLQKWRSKTPQDLTIPDTRHIVGVLTDSVSCSALLCSGTQGYLTLSPFCKRHSVPLYSQSHQTNSETTAKWMVLPAWEESDSVKMLLFLPMEW